MRRALALALVFAAAAPALAQDGSRMTDAQLMAWATEVRACQDREVVEVRYLEATGNRVTVICGDATGFLPLAGFAGLGTAGTATALAGVGLALAVGSGGGGSTPDTQ